MYENNLRGSCRLGAEIPERLHSVSMCVSGKTSLALQGCCVFELSNLIYATSLTNYSCDDVDISQSN